MLMEYDFYWDKSKKVALFVVFAGTAIVYWKRIVLRRDLSDNDCKYSSSKYVKSEQGVITPWSEIDAQHSNF